MLQLKKGSQQMRNTPGTEDIERENEKNNDALVGRGYGQSYRSVTVISVAVSSSYFTEGTRFLCSPIPAALVINSRVPIIRKLDYY